MTKTKLRPVAAAISSVLLLAGLQQAHGAGFALIENSASGMGTAFAGASAVGEDASTIFFNPAGMTQLKGPQLVFSAHVIGIEADYKDKGSSLNPAFTGGTTVPGSLQGTNDDGGGVGVIPNLFYAYPVNEDLYFGLGISVPFGMETEYEDEWVGRYHALYSGIETLNVNPSFAYRLNDRWSIGGGFNVQYLKADLTQAIDSTAVCLQLVQQGAIDMATCENAGMPASTLASGTVDSKAELKADDISYGFNLGVTFQATERTRIGAAYRSRVNHDAEGDADFTLYPGLEAILTPVNQQLAQAGTALLANSDVGGSISLPDTFSLSVVHQATPKLQVLGDITWTGWSSFDELRIVYDSGQADSVTDESWEDVMRYSLGVAYAQTDRLTLRAGLAFDEEAIPDDEHRTPRIPGNDRFWITLGAGYKVNRNLTLDVGYAHLSMSDTDMSHDDGNGYTVTGEYSGGANILSGQLTWNF
ncbi:outer membrane protein transport protein [Granulosicoccaceae sp. 1_MG-2023]|nr:outer membrane protein transport protein [Granulosicoccaceae sp. 1_MG-2023]